jgi:AraC-like DNA-binding protein
MTTQGLQRRDVNAAARATQAVELRMQRLPYEEIAKRCGYADRATCYNAVQREMQRRVVVNVDALRAEETASLDLLEQECWKIFYNKDREKAQLFAVDRILAIKERRARLLGLDIAKDANIAAAQIIIREYAADVEAV